MNQKIQTIPFRPQRLENPVDAADVLDIAGQYDVGPQRLHQRLEALGLRLALIGECQFRALGRERFRNAPGDRMIIGDAHDQPAFALHQLVHIAPYLITRSVCCLAPHFAGSRRAMLAISWRVRVRDSPARECRMCGTCSASPRILPGEVKTKSHASIRLNTSVALVPPNPNEFESTVPSLALSMRLRTIGMSAKAESSSWILALSQMKPLFIISNE